MFFSVVLCVCVFFSYEFFAFLHLIISAFFSQWACCCFWLHCMWNQIHLIRISISTKIPSDLLIYFANDWIQYANLSGRLCQGELCDIMRYCVILMYIGHLSCWLRRWGQNKICLQNVRPFFVPVTCWRRCRCCWRCCCYWRSCCCFHAFLRFDIFCSTCFLFFTFRLNFVYFILRIFFLGILWCKCVCICILRVLKALLVCDFLSLHLIRYCCK